MDRRTPDHRAGFNLIAVSIILAVASLVLVALLPGQERGGALQKSANTIIKLQKVEEAMKGYMAVNNRRPCPADGSYAINSANFGVEATNVGSCLDGTGGTPVANFSGTSVVKTGNTTINSFVVTGIGTTAGLSPGLSVSGTEIPLAAAIASVDSTTQITLTLPVGNTISGDSLIFTNNIVGGVIPTKTLGLPDDYALDEFGRRITYVVDKRATEAKSCMVLENTKLDGSHTGIGGVAIESATGGTLIDQTMYAYISHGQDGHGAFPGPGSSVAGRINTGSTDADQLTNAGVNSSFVYNTTNFTNVKVRKEPTTGFDDIVYYADYLKNTCCLGPNCPAIGFRADGDRTGSDMAISGVVVGDVNGDGIPDLIMADTLRGYPVS